MAFRDDRDAQLARAAALERENRRLEEELARHKAEAAAAAEAMAAAEARGRAAGERERQAAAHDARARLAEENAELREELERARGPGLLRRTAAWIAGLRLERPSGDGGYWRTALLAWRIHVPVVAGLLVTAPFLGTRAVLLALLAPVAAAALAAIVLAVPWLLRRRRSDVAGGIAGAAIGPVVSLALVDRMLDGEMSTSMYLTMGAVVVALAGMLLTRAVSWSESLALGLIFSPILALPTPAHFLVWMALAVAGSELAQAPDASRARR